MGRIIKGYWDCPSCGTEGIEGSQRECPGCGKARGDDVKFYMKDPHDYLSEEDAAKASREADWYCSFCNSLNPASATECQSCGSSKEDSEKNYHDLQKESAEKKEKLDAKWNQPAPEKPKKGGLGKKILIALGILLLIGIISNLIPKNVDAEIASIGWERNISIEQWTDVQESDWELPPTANLHEKKQEIHHTEQVIDHYEDVAVEKTREVQDGYDISYEQKDLGNGNFEEIEIKTPRYVTETYTEIEKQPVYREDPVYKTKYYYDIWKWVPTRSVATNGTDHNAKWGDVTLASDEQEGEKTELYTITVKSKKGKTETYSLDESSWNTVNVGDSVIVKTKGGNAQLLDSGKNFIADLEEVK